MEDSDFEVKINEKVICAGYTSEGINYCKRDIGGPVFQNKILHGIVSPGSDCSEFCLPGVFVNVYRYVSWINDTIDWKFKKWKCFKTFFGRTS